jgi:hypothetical protein
MLTTSYTPVGLAYACANPSTAYTSSSTLATAINYSFAVGLAGWTNMVGCYQDRFVIAYSGTLWVPTEGTYWFNTFSDDSADLFIDNVKIVSDPSEHAPQWASATGSSVFLTKGPHSLTSHICEMGGGIAYEVHWKVAGSTVAWEDKASAQTRCGAAYGTTCMPKTLVPKSAFAPPT